MNHLPNALTLGRIAVTPVVALLALSQEPTARYWAVVLFTVAAVSDIFDGYFARRFDVVSNIGRLLDPLADKLLLLATFVPLYVISHRRGGAEPLPWWGEMPLWVLLVILGRELVITGFRGYAVSRGVVISAGWPGKRKTLFQLLFSGFALFWYPLSQSAEARGWSGRPVWEGWRVFHETFVAVMLGLALLLTVYSMLHYAWIYRSIIGTKE